MNELYGYSAFLAHRRLANGKLEEVLAAVKTALDGGERGQLLVFDNETGKQVDFDLRGSLEEVLERIRPAAPKPGPGRPRLGVKSAEVTLLPRHWEWLERNSTNASGSLRRLVDAAMKEAGGKNVRRERIDAASRFLWSIAGDLPGFEEATRALYASKWRELWRLAAAWPEGLLAQLEWMLEKVFDIDEREMSFHGRRIEALGPARDREAVDSTLPPWQWTAGDLVATIRRGRLSAGEIVESQLERIASINPGLNALTRVFAKEARKLASEIDKRLARGEEVGPLAGLPFTVKGNIDVAGFATDHGVPALRDAIPPIDAPLVARLREAGAIPLAHSNLPDLSLRFHTRSSLHGPTLNPWDPADSPGGSSGGEGVALATGMSPLGLGNDAGGSVRIPATLGGLCSLKPSYGRYPSDRSVGQRDLTLASQLIPVEGLLARSVADLHLVHQILAYPDPRDPRVGAAPALIEKEEGPMRVALLLDPCGEVCDPKVKAGLLTAAEALRGAGYEVVEERGPGLDAAVESYGGMIMTEFGESRELLSRLVGDDGRRYLELAAAYRKPVDLGAYLALTARRQGLQRDWARFLENYPLVLGPVLTRARIPVDFDIVGPREHAEVTRSMCLCSATSFLGLPAVSVPVGIANGHPLGAQLVGAYQREDRCLSAAWAIERALGTFTPLLAPAMP